MCALQVCPQFSNFKKQRARAGPAGRTRVDDAPSTQLPAAPPGRVARGPHPRAPEAPAVTRGPAAGAASVPGSPPGAAALYQCTAAATCASCGRSAQASPAPPALRLPLVCQAVLRSGSAYQPWCLPAVRTIREDPLAWAGVQALWRSERGARGTACQQAQVRGLRASACAVCRLGQSGGVRGRASSLGYGRMRMQN